MTYFKLSLLCYFVLTNCFFYAYSSETKLIDNNTKEQNKKVPKVVTKDVPIDIYVLLDDSEIPKEESQVKEFLYNVGKYEQNHEEDAFGGTLIKCTTEDQEITLSFELANGDYCVCFQDKELIKNMREGIEKLIENCSYNKDTCHYSQIVLYTSLLKLFDEDFNEKYESFLMCTTINKVIDMFYYDISKFKYEEGGITILKKGDFYNCNTEFVYVDGVKIFLKYKCELKDFYERFIDNSLEEDFSARINEFKKQLTKLNSDFDEQKKKLNGGCDIGCISGKLEKMQKDVNYLLYDVPTYIVRCHEKKQLLQKNSIKFNDLLYYIDELNKTYNEKLQSIEKDFNEVSNQISKMHEEKNKEEKKEKVIIINDNNNNNASNANNMQEQKKQVPIDIYVLLDDSEILKEESQVKEFLYNVGKYDQNHEEDAFCKTLIPCTTGDQKITLLFEQPVKNGFWTISFESGEIIESMRVGINKLKGSYSDDKNIYYYSKNILYDILLELLYDNFDKNYENCLICNLTEKFSFTHFYSDIPSIKYKENIHVHFSDYDLSKNDNRLDYIQNVKIFFKYKGGFKDFCEHLLHNCFVNVYAVIEDLQERIQYLNSYLGKRIFESGNVDSEIYIFEYLKKIYSNLITFYNEICVSIKAKAEKISQRNNGINFVEFNKYIEEQNKTNNEKLQSIKKAIDKVSKQILKMLQDKNKKENKEKLNIDEEENYEDTFEYNLNNFTFGDIENIYSCEQDNNNNEQEKNNVKNRKMYDNNNKEKNYNANMKGMSVLNNAYKDGDKEEVNAYNAAHTSKMDGQNNNDDTNVQYTKANHNSIPVQYNNNNFFPINARNRTIEIENDGTTTVGPDFQQIEFIQIPKKKVLNNSKLGLRKVCSCKRMSRN